MRLKLKYRTIFITALILSVFCAIYLNFQWNEGTNVAMQVSGEFGSSSAFTDRSFFTEVEVIKIVLEKIIDLVTISRL